jgi:hypothetical protein
LILFTLPPFQVSFSRPFPTPTHSLSGGRAAAGVGHIASQPQQRGTNSKAFVPPIPTPHGQPAGIQCSTSNRHGPGVKPRAPGNGEDGAALRDGQPSTLTGSAPPAVPQTSPKVSSEQRQLRARGTRASRHRPRDARRAADRQNDVTALSRDNILERILQLQRVGSTGRQRSSASIADEEANGGTIANLPPHLGHRRSSAPVVAGLAQEAGAATESASSLGRFGAPLTGIPRKTAGQRSREAPGIETTEAAMPPRARRATVCTDRIALNESSKAHELWTQLVVSNVSNIPFAMRQGHAHPVAAARALSLVSSAMAAAYGTAGDGGPSPLPSVGATGGANGDSTVPQSPHADAGRSGPEKGAASSTESGESQTKTTEVRSLWGPQATAERHSSHLRTPPPGRRSDRARGERSPGQITSDADILASVRLALRDSMQEGAARNAAARRPISYAS